MYSLLYQMLIYVNIILTYQLLKNFKLKITNFGIIQQYLLPHTNRNLCTVHTQNTLIGNSRPTGYQITQG